MRHTKISVTSHHSAMACRRRKKLLYQEKYSLGTTSQWKRNLWYVLYSWWYCDKLEKCLSLYPYTWLLKCFCYVIRYQEKGWPILLREPACGIKDWPLRCCDIETIIHTEQKDKSSALTARPWHFLSDIKVYHIVSRTINKLVKSNVTLISWWRHSTRWLIQKVNTKETRMMEGE